MKIQPIQSNQPTMGMKYTRKIYRLSEISNNIKDYITLDNGKEVQIHTAKINGKMISKLIYLKDELGSWVRSKLTFYNHKGKRSLVKISNNIKDNVNE